MPTGRQVWWTCPPPGPILPCFLTKPNKPAKRAQDLRPIALQSAGAKAVLLTIKDRLMPFFLAAMVQLPQCAYVAARGTTEAILRVTLHCVSICDIIQTQKMTIHDHFAGAQRAACAGGIQMSLDLSKAFDMLSHEVVVLAISRAGVSVDLQNVIMAFYDQSVYVIKRRGSKHLPSDCATARSTAGLHSVVCAMGLVYCLYYACDGHPQWCGLASRHCTMYADDMHFAWQATSVEHLAGILRVIRVIFDVLRALGMQVNPAKSSLLLGLRGPLADKWMKRRVSRDRVGVRHLRYGPALCDRIPIVPSFVYLGVVISYRNFEDLTLRHRLTMAAGHRARLRRILHAKKVLTSPERARHGRYSYRVRNCMHWRQWVSRRRACDFCVCRPRNICEASSARLGILTVCQMLVNTHVSLTQRCDSLCRRLAGAPQTAVNNRICGFLSKGGGFFV